MTKYDIFQMAEEKFDTFKITSIITSNCEMNHSRTKVLPNDVGGGQGCQESHGQTKTKVIRPIPLNIGQPLVHFNTWNNNNRLVSARPSEFANHFG